MRPPAMDGMRMGACGISAANGIEQKHGLLTTAKSGSFLYVPL